MRDGDIFKADKFEALETTVTGASTEQKREMTLVVLDMNPAF